MLLLAFNLASCNKISGEGELNNYAPSLATFTSIDIEIPAEITIISGNESKMSINIQDNIYKNTDIYVKDGELNIEFDKNIRKFKPITIEIEMNNIDEIDLSGAAELSILDLFNISNEVSISTSGSCSVNVLDTLYCNDFKYESSGFGSLEANYIVVNNNTEIETSGSGNNKIKYIKTNTLEYDASGAGKIEISGEANNQDLKNSGSAKYFGTGFITKNTEIKTSGSGYYEVHATTKLDIEASGSGAVKYKGNPTISHDISGSFKLEKLD